MARTLAENDGFDFPFVHAHRSLDMVHSTSKLCDVLCSSRLFSRLLVMRFIFYFLLLIPACAFADQSSDFLAAHDAFIAGDTVKLGRYAQRLKKSPLEVYISYYQLSLNMKNTDTKHVEESVKSFLARPEDTPMIDLLRGEWLKLLGMRQQWELFDAEYPRLLNEDTELACYALQSRRRNHELDALREARKLWFTGKGQPDSCGKLFEAAMAANIISEQDVDRKSVV